ncbi:MAG TPA: tetratricopeptide repeat protein [Streptosporangiaceae bacterium]|nr:tetratricopeptide repeat protein [Streptosporangiaceae bacterium]
MIIIDREDEVGGHHDLRTGMSVLGDSTKLIVATASVNTALMTRCARPIRLADRPWRFILVGCWTMPTYATHTAAAKRQRLAQRRKALGLTQEALAELLAVERSTVARWERGQSEPLPWMRPKLARALKVSADRLETLLAAIGPAAALTAPRQLPHAVADFTGRTTELRALTQILDHVGDDTPGTVVISAIGGMAGVGKTTLALHWAHQAASRFPDGQLYVNLRGFDPSGTAATPGEAIRGFLDALAVPSERIPASLEGQVGLYRSLLAQRQVLLVLDNARDEQQVRPLLPASSGTLVLVTSRNKLAGLAAADGARLLSLDVLSHDEARQLLSARIGQARAAAEPEAVAEITRLCACLPLALAVAAGRAAARPSLPLGTIAAELRDMPNRLDALDISDPACSVQAVFSWSYQQLSPDTAQMFRLLGLLPGPDISVPAAASLAALPLDLAGRHFGELASAHLITEHLPGRYAFHDLLRAYAASQARATGDDRARHEAIARALDHYLHTADAAALLIRPARIPITIPPRRPGVTPETLADYQQALNWFEAEHHVLRSAAFLAEQTGFSVHGWQLPWSMRDYLDMKGHWEEEAALHRTALAAAMRLGDKPAEADIRRMLAYGYARLGNYDQAGPLLAECLALCRHLGDRSREAKAAQTLSWVAEQQDHYADALNHAEHALALFQVTDYLAGQAAALNSIGWYHTQLGSYTRARAACQRALDIYRELGTPEGEAAAWDSLGYVEHHLGRFAAAKGCYQHGLAIVRELGDRVSESEVLIHLGDTHHAAGEAQAQNAWRQALEILDDLHHPKADQVRVKLASTDG